MPKEEKKKRILIYILAIIFILIFLNSIIVTINYRKEKNTTVENITDNIPAPKAGLVQMYLPAVSSDNKGVPTKLSVEALPGKGRTLVNIEGLLFWADTQQSIRQAILVAENISGIKTKNYDLIYNIEANASLIGGQSAGAALTIATIAALENKTLNKEIMITGAINHDGTIGPVSAILEKAKAAKAAGAKTFLVPLLQSRDVLYETIQHCENFGPSQICTSETIPKKVDITQETGLNVTEVTDIREAMNYFFS